MSKMLAYVPFIRKPVIPRSIIIMMVETRSYEAGHLYNKHVVIISVSERGSEWWVG